MDSSLRLRVPRMSCASRSPFGSFRAGRTAHPISAARVRRGPGTPASSTSIPAAALLRLARAEPDLLPAQRQAPPRAQPDAARPEGTLARARLPAIRMHDLRHLHNTTLMREGVSARIVQERVGHASVAFTLGQDRWVTPDLQELAVEALTRSLARAPEAATEAATGLLPDQAVRRRRSS